MLRDRYRLDALIASGGMGDVWRGTDLAIDRRVAIKLLRSEHADDEDGLARFRAEAHHAGSLSHPNIAQVFDYGEARATEPGYLVMELVEGLSLTRILDDGPLPPGDVMDVVAQAARGLAAAHQAGLVHRDIKPGNLLVRLDGLVKITDFGIATAAGENPVTQPVTQPGMLIGTPAYLAPERISGVPATPATDLYALGVVAHQCLTGKVPFAGEPLAVALAHLDRGIPPLPPSVPPAVAALVADLTRQDPAARPGSAWDVAVRAEHLRVILSGPEAPSPGDATATLPARADGAGLASPPGLARWWLARWWLARWWLVLRWLAGCAVAGSGGGWLGAWGRRPAPHRRPPAAPPPRPRRGREPPGSPAAAARPGPEQGQPAGPRGPGADRRRVGRVHQLDAGHVAQSGCGAPAVRGPAGVQPEPHAEPPAPAEPGRGHAQRRQCRRGAGGRHPAGVHVGPAAPVRVADAHHARADHAGAHDAGADHAGAHDAGADHAGADHAGAHHARCPPRPFQPHPSAHSAPARRPRPVSVPRPRRPAW